MSLANRVISTARHIHYSITEPIKLRACRFFYEMDYSPDDLIWNGPHPLISVIIPTFNRCDLLVQRALRSVFLQVYQNVEVLVCAHGCTDGTAEAVRKLARGETIHFGPLGSYDDVGKFVTTGTRYQRQRVQKPPNMSLRLIEVPRTRTYPESPENHWFAGPVVPINAGLAACDGDWIARIDDDDEWTPDHLEKLLYSAQAGNLEFVSSAYETERDGTRFHIPHDHHRTKPIGGVQTWLYRSYLRGFKANPDCWRKSYDRVNDTDLAQRFRNAGVRIGHLNEVTAYVKPRPGTNLIGLAAYRNDERGTMETLAFR